MTDIQVMTLAIAILVPLSLLLLSNTRIGDAKEILRAEIQVVRAETSERFTRMDARFDRLEAKMDSHHDTVMRLLADIDARVTKLEERG